MFPMKKIEQGRASVALSSAVRPVCVAACVCLMTAGACATAATLEPVVVTATRSDQPLSEVVADITVIDRATLQREVGQSVEDILAKQPGIQITRTGGPGTETVVHVRGATKQHTAVYLDGIRIDAQNGSGGANWEAIPASLIERIEILRGPAGAVYGSDALAGVVQIFTQRGAAGFAPYVSVGAGAHQTYQQEAGLSGSAGRWDYALGLSYADSQGFDSKTNAARNTDADGYTRKAAHGRLGWQLTNAHRLDATVLRSDSNAAYDASKSTQDDRGVRALDAYGLTWSARWSAAHQMRLSASESVNTYETRGTSTYFTETTLRNYLLQNDWQLGTGMLNVTLERREDTLDNADLKPSPRKQRQQNAVALGYGLQWDAHTLQANVRSDEDSDFGRKNTASLGYGWRFAPHWKATASMATGFHAPTLFQRFSAYGDSSLAPEESLNKELGLHWQVQDKQLGMTLYRNQIKNLVAYTSGQGSCGQSACYLNVDRAVLEGITLSGAYRWNQVKAYGSVDFQNPHNEKTGKQLQRRSKRFATAGVQLPAVGVNWDAQVQTTSRRYDKEGGVDMLGGYTLVNLSASKPLGKDFTLTARIDNLLDRDYTLAKDYATAGRTFFVQLKWMPQ